jgi:putative protein kinase ArgK-like GTPase of G3E family
VVLLVQPESGDEVQWEKAGILELADVVVVHKADLPAAEQTAAQVQAALGLTPLRQVPVVGVSSQTGQGLAALWQAIVTRPLRRAQPAAEELLQLAQEEVARRWRAAERRGQAEFVQIVGQWRQGQSPTAQTVERLFHWLFRSEPET